MNEKQSNKQINVLTKILKANDDIADQNRQFFSEHNILAINIIGTPGSGKTALLEASAPLFEQKGMKIAVIVGDIMTTNDAERISACNIPVVQIITDAFGGSCHLEAVMIKNALAEISNSFGATASMDILFIENVGNLVCPAEFDLGEQLRVVVTSVTEGEDKPSKYPLAFRTADLVLLNKIDLLPYLKFNLDKFKNNVIQINAKAPIYEISALEAVAPQANKKNLDAWINFVLDHKKKR